MLEIKLYLFELTVAITVLFFVKPRKCLLKRFLEKVEDILSPTVSKKII